MKDLVFLPIKEEYLLLPYQIYYTEFKLGFLQVIISMFDTNKFISAFKLEKGEKLKNYLIMLTIGKNSWITYTNDSYNMTETMYKLCVSTLKEGGTWEFHDFGRQKNKPVQVNWQCIRFEW